MYIPFRWHYVNFESTYAPLTFHLTTAALAFTNCTESIFFPHFFTILFIFYYNLQNHQLLNDLKVPR